MSDFTLTPPLRYNRVQTSLARGATPTSQNIPFLKLFHVNTMIALTPESIFESESKFYEQNKELIKFIESNNINYLHFPTDSNVKDKGKNREIPITHEQVTKILEVILNKDSGNTYIFCSNGGQITSLVVACLRKVQLWSSVSIFEEFVCYSSSANHNDRRFVDEFPADLKINSKSKRVDWLWCGLNENVIINHPCLKNIKFISQ
jgi:tyrosine-protein phosphatase OCA6